MDDKRLNPIFLIQKIFNMKKTLLSSCLAIVLSATTVYAQDCAQYLFLQKGKTIEVSVFNKKGDPNGRNVYSVSDVTTGGGTTTGKLASEVFDKKGKSVAKAASVIKCTGGVMLIDMKLMLPQQQAGQFSNAEVKANDGLLEYPVTMIVGDALKDGSLNMDMNNQGMVQTLAMVINNRKVEAQESVTTTAGTWNCYKISFKSKITVKTGPIGIPFSFEGTEWYAPGVGIVKTENKNGSTAVTSIH
jgi:hypothetical protein